MGVNKKVPAIRFKGFDDEWKIELLENIAQYKNGSSHENKQCSKGKFELINLNSISIDGRFKPSGKFIDEANETLQINDLIMVLSDVGYGNLLGRVAIIPENNKYVLNQRVALLRVFNEKEYNVSFLYNYINSHQSYFKVNGAGMSQLNISKRTVEKFEFFKSKITEQTQIGNYFKELDEVIHLQEQKYEKLKQLKTAMLSKMFPKAGADVPQIRFKGFTDKWKEKELSTISDIIGGGTPSTMNSDFWNGNINWFSPTEIGNKVYVSESNKKITKLGLEKSSATILPAFKTVLFTSRAGIGDSAILQLNACTNQGFQSFIVKKDIDVYFLYSMTPLIKKEAIKYASGSTFLEISSKSLGKLIFKFPTFKEQQKIGAYFENLDELIACSQQQLEKYKNIKQALLQKMFV